MRILHFADLHIGVENYSKIDPATGISSRLKDFLSALDELVNYALNYEIDLVLFCGDAYKSRDPSQTQQREFAKRVGILAKNGIKVFLLVGNHDLPNAIGRATSLEIFDTLAIKNVIVGNQIKNYTIKTKHGVVQVVALPWIRRSEFLSKENARNLTFEEINARIEKSITDRLMSSALLDPNIPTILAGHILLSNAKIGSERASIVGREHTLHLNSIISIPFDYVALGHIHSYQVLHSNPPVVYSGSLQTVDFNEEGDEKGFCVVEIDVKNGEKKVSYEFHPVKTRPFVTISVDADTNDPTAAVVDAISKMDIKDAIVRVQIRTSPICEPLIRETEILKALEDAHFVAGITREVDREPRVRLKNSSVEELVPLEILKAYLRSKNMSPEQEKLLLEYGERLIEQVKASEE